MIDIESDVFDVVAKALRVAHTGITVVGEYTEIPAKFPAVTLVEADNRVARSWRTCEKMENAVNVMYELNVYSNKSSGKKIKIIQIVWDRFPFSKISWNGDSINILQNIMV